MSFSTVSSSECSYNRAEISRPSSPSPSGKTQNGCGGGMLSMDFSAPLTGQARAERIKQMSKNHPAFEKSRLIQKIIYNVQTSLRRMPGVAASEAEEIINQLKEVSGVVNQEITQLVDAMMNLTLDGEETGKAVTRMSLDSSFAKANTENLEGQIRDLEKQLQEEREQRGNAEAEMTNLSDQLQARSSEYSRLQDKVSSGSHGAPPAAIKAYEDVIRHLEEQVNNRRSLWVMKHRDDPAAVSRAIETLADSIKERNVVESSLSHLRSAASGSHPHPGSMQPFRHGGEGGHLGSRSPLPPRAPSAFQQLQRPSSVRPPSYSPLISGPPARPTSTRPQSRHFQGFGNGAPPSQLASPGAYSRAPSRKGFQGQSSRYREFQPSGFGDYQPPARPGTAFTPTRDSMARGRPTSRASQEYGDSSGFGAANGALVPRSAHGVGPLVHLDPRSVTEWSERIGDFYSGIHQFVDMHAGQPLAELSDSFVASSVWPILVRTYLPLSEAEAASYLEYHLRDKQCKKCLVTRLVVDYVVNLVWVPSAWRGADPDTTYTLSELEKDLVRTHGQPSATRQPLLDKQAAVLDSIMKHNEPGSEFHKNKLAELTGTLLNSLTPLLNPTTDTHAAYSDLMKVAEQAWELSSKILSSRLTFDFRFPEIGSRFSNQSMIPIWPTTVTPVELQARHWRVSMVTTPVVTCRNDTGTNISAHSVALADVICMQ